MNRAMQLLSSLRCEDGTKWGDRAAEWQRLDAEAILDPPPDGPTMHFLTRGLVVAPRRRTSQVWRSPRCSK